MKIDNVVVMSVVFVLAACAPLQQAPLVYSSKTSMGIDLSTPTSEQPGVSINIGFKQVDAAYVPVAVAKECNSAKVGQNCEDDTYKLHKITAYNNADDSRLADRKVNEAKEKIRNLFALISARDDVKSSFEALVQRSGEKNPQIQKLKADPNYQTGSAKAKEGRSGEERVAVDAFEQLKKKDDALIEEKSQALAKAESALANFIKDEDVKNLAADLKLIASNDAKEDAYSVFGSFDGKTGANGHFDSTGKPTGEASLVIGKVFSTGVASQFLTQGLRALYSGKGNSSCLNQAALLSQDFAKSLNMDNSEDKKKMADFSARLVGICAPVVASQ